MLISCDEGGFTGPNLLDPSQPVFSYASIDLTASEAQAIIDKVRERYHIQAPELKSSRLRSRGDWLGIANDIAEMAGNRAIVVAFDKRLNLCGKAYEYFFEPALEQNNEIFYRSGFHIYLLNALNSSLYTQDCAPDDLASELQAFMRSFNPADAPTLFHVGKSLSSSSAILDCILRFTRGYAGKIAGATDHIRFDNAKWTLDLTSTSLFQVLLCGWGLRYPSIEVLCDSSKPLQAVAPFFNEFVGRTEPFQLLGPDGPFEVRCNLSQALSFGSSDQNPTLQIADILAGITADAFLHQSDQRYLSFVMWTKRHCNAAVFPDPVAIDRRQLRARVNSAVLTELARRADLNIDPLEGITEFYRQTLLDDVPP